MARVKGFVVTASIFVPYDVDNLDTATDVISAVKAADRNDISKLSSVGGLVLKTSRAYTSKEFTDVPAEETEAAEDDRATEQDSAEAGPAEATDEEERAQTSPRMGRSRKAA